MSNWNYNVESLNTFGCGVCGSEDLAFCGETEHRTETNVTDVVTCESCKTEWVNPIVQLIDVAAKSMGVTPTDSQMDDMLARAEAVKLDDMAPADAAIIARGIVGTYDGPDACAACGMPYAGSHYLGCPEVE